MRTSAPRLRGCPRDRSWVTVLVCLVPSVLVAQSQDAAELHAESLVAERIQTIRDLLPESDPERRLASAISPSRSPGEVQNRVAPRSPTTGRPLKVRSLSILIRPEEEVLPAFAELLTTAESWFDWPSIAGTVGAGLEYDLALPPPTELEVRQYLLERHGPFLKMALRLRSGTERFVILDSRRHPNADVTVIGELTSGTTDVATLSFRLRRVGATYLFVDLRLNDFSVLDDVRSWYFRRWLDTVDAEESQ